MATKKTTATDRKKKTTAATRKKPARTGKQITRAQILKKLSEIIDPELNINIVDLGLIYDVEIKNGKVKLTMTFTTPACPLMGFIAEQVEAKLFEMKFKDVHVHVTFNPPWSTNKMSEKAKAVLGV
ncbi:MAG: metal-sulfur cluster assembly factor [Candidatus Micrarchaeia archaeon]